MRNLAIGGSILLLALTAAGPALAEFEVPAAFCADLKEVTSDAGNDFARFRGPRIGEPETDADGYTSIDYTALKSLSGATLCEIGEYIPPDRDALKSYRCEWLPSGVSRSDVAGAVAVAVRECVGVGDPMDSLTFYEGDVARAYIYSDDFDINISVGSMPQVFLWIRQ